MADFGKAHKLRGNPRQRVRASLATVGVFGVSSTPKMTPQPAKEEAPVQRKAPNNRAWCSGGRGPMPAVEMIRNY
jgi:hypothetical protein